MNRGFFLFAVVTLSGCPAPIPGVDSGTDAPAPIDAPSTSDTPPAVDAPVDARTPDAPAHPCDLSAPFGPPELVDGASTTDSETSGQLSDDEREIIFSCTAGGGSEDICRMTRDARTSAFTGRMVITALSSTTYDYVSHVSDGGILFVSTRTGMGDVYFAERMASGDFLAPMLVDDLSTPLGEGGSWLSTDGAFVSRLDGDWDILFAPESGVGFGSPTAIDDIDTPSNDQAPVLSDDELVMYYATDRDGGMGAYDIWMTTRDDRTARWETPEVVANVNSASRDYPNDLSTDGCRLYFDSDRSTGPGAFDLYVAERPAL